MTDGKGVFDAGSWAFVIGPLPFVMCTESGESGMANETMTDGKGVFDAGSWAFVIWPSAIRHVYGKRHGK